MSRQGRHLGSRIGFLLPALLLVVSEAAAGAAHPSLASVPDLEIQRLSRQTEKLRGLRFLQPVEYGIESRTHLRKRMTSLMQEEWGKAGLKQMARVLKAFDLISAQLDLTDLLTDLFTEQVAGFYDPREKKLFLTRDEEAAPGPLEGAVAGLLGLKMDALILVHELTHALDDQHFDLTRLEKGARGLEDGPVALQALEEGIATLTMMMYILDRAGLEETVFPGLLRKMDDLDIVQAMPADSVLSLAPPVIRRSLTFPYQGGLRFVLEEKRKGGWERINELLRHPPVSSEQILHPAKAESPRDNPVEVSLPDFSSRKRRLISMGTMGELDLLSVLERGQSEEQARQAAAGWGGDRFSLYAQGTGKADLLIWLTVWDDEGEAAEFQSSYNGVLDSRFHQTAGVRQRIMSEGLKRIIHLDRARGGRLVERRGGAVLVIQGAGSRTLSTMSRRVWSHFQTSQRESLDIP